MDPGSCIVIEVPKTEPVSLALARKQCRFTANDEDELIELYIAAARETTQAFLRRSLIRQKRRLVLDTFASCIYLPFGRTMEVTEVSYMSEAGAWQVVPTQTWEADLSPDLARLMPRFGMSWPTPQAGPARVRVDYVAGYGAAEGDVPANIRAAMLLMIAESFENREDSISGTTIAEIPASSRNLLRPYVVYGTV